MKFAAVGVANSMAASAWWISAFWITAAPAVSNRSPSQSPALPVVEPRKMILSVVVPTALRVPTTISSVSVPPAAPSTMTPGSRVSVTVLLTCTSPVRTCGLSAAYQVVSDVIAPL